jgi:pyridoxamine 5'-phosphate oxidase
MTQTDTRVRDSAHPEFDLPPDDPMDLFRSWFGAAKETGVREPGALVLGTVDEHGNSSGRVVAITGVTDDGVLFTSHAASGKGRDLAHTPRASGVLYWRETRQQISVAGPTVRLSEQDSDELWAARPASTYPMSVASTQSAPLADEEALRARARELAESADPLPRPEGWYGYRLTPDTLEFWLEGTDRLHRRLRYDRAGAGWSTRRLQP